jgi:inward rectifier potassium channel
MGTIGFGVLAPGDTFANTIVTIECFFGIALTAMITGVFFSRFATAEARVIFSKVAVVHTFDGKRTLMFRMCNARATAIVEATVRVYLSRDEKTIEGERVRRIHDLALRRNNSPIFGLSWTVYHVLDEASPLFHLSTESLVGETSNIIVTFQGTDDRLAATVHTRYSYNASDIRIDEKLVDIIKIDPETNVRYLDFDEFHRTVPFVPPAIGPGSPA